MTENTRVNYAVKSDQRFNKVRSDSYGNHSLPTYGIIGYSQVRTDTAQTLFSSTRTQLLNNATGVETYNSDGLWNTANNRINLRNAKVGDLVNVKICLSFITTAIAQTSIELDYSPLLNGSLTVFPGRNTELVVATPGVQEAIIHSMDFVVNETMIKNGVGVMVTSTTGLGVLTKIFNISRFSGQSELNN